MDTFVPGEYTFVRNFSQRENHCLWAGSDRFAVPQFPRGVSSHRGFGGHGGFDGRDHRQLESSEVLAASKRVSDPFESGCGTG